MRRRAESAGLRWHLAGLVLVVLLPLGLLSAGVLYLLWEAQAEQVRVSHRDLAQALAVAVDREVEGTIQRAQMLATHPDLDPAAPERFAKVARAALESSRGWENIVLIDAAGRQLMNLAATQADDLTPLGDRAYVRQVATTGRPAVSDLIVGRTRNKPLVVVAVPVRQASSTDSMLLVSLDLNSLNALLTQQQVIPKDGVAAIIDGGYRILARSSKAAEYLGRHPVPALAAALERGEDGAAPLPTLDGKDVYAAWARIPASGWWVAVGLPLESARNALMRHLVLLMVALGTIIAAAVLLALVLSKRIVRSISAATQGAAAVARGEPASVPRSTVSELNVLGSALEQAASRLAAAERDRDRLLQEERNARTVAEQATRAKDEFLAMLGHELRNPLAPIVTALKLIKMRRGGELPREHEIIERQVGYLTRLVDDLLDISRITRGKVQLKRQRVELAEVTAEAIETASPLLEQRRHHFRADVARTGLAVYADPTRVAQVIANLLTNAAKYTPPGGNIEVTAGREGAGVWLRVTDNGTGIPEDLLPKVFDIFAQGATAADRAEGGLGIGLALVKNLVLLHGGSVSADSAGPGRGSQFTVRLPAYTPEIVGSAPAAATPQIGQSEAPQRVLVVDDNREAAELTAELLRAAGHDAVVATNPIDALETLDGFRPTVALLDIGLPGMDGYELARRVHERCGDAAPRLIALTGYSLNEARIRATGVHFEAHLLKPFDGEALLRLIEDTAARVDAGSAEQS